MPLWPRAGVGMPEAAPTTTWAADVVSILISGNAGPGWTTSTRWRARHQVPTAPVGAGAIRSAAVVAATTAVPLGDDTATIIGLTADDVEVAEFARRRCPARRVTAPTLT